MQEGPSHHQHHRPLLIHHHHQQQPPPPQQRSQRYGSGGLMTTAGEIVEVQGGHIVRSTGRKDRHSKVCTAKGPRDRRVRLSAQTAIQFYDVQDRLGYDRPSKAVDWLIKNARTAIAELAELPAWHPTATAAAAANQEAAAAHGESSNKQMLVAEKGSSSQYEFNSGGGGGGGSSFLPPSLGSDAIADTIKSFFPMNATAASSPSPPSSLPIGFQSYPPPDLLSRNSSQNQDLRLSLQSFQDPIFHQHHHNAAQHHQENDPNPNAASSHHAALFSAFDASAIIPWNMAELSSGSGGGNAAAGGGYVFNVPLQQQPATMAMHPALGQSQFFTQRGPLQSSNLPFVRAWADPMAAVADHHPMQQHSVIHPSIGFTSGAGSGGFSGFRIPSRIQGEEEHDGISDKPSSASSGSYH